LTDLEMVDLEKSLVRRGQDNFRVNFQGYATFYILAASVNAIGRFFAGHNNNLITRVQVRLRPGPCVGPAIDVLTVPNTPNPPGLNGDETEHTLEPQFSARFLETAVCGLLRGRYVPINAPPPIDARPIINCWDDPLHQFNNAPAVGGPSGATPINANDRMMEGFGSEYWPQPLLAVDAQINGPKASSGVSTIPLH
jgi:hypothetical protein